MRTAKIERYTPAETYWSIRLDVHRHGDILFGLSIMRRARHILAVTLVATAICADRAVASAPVLRGESMVSSMAARFVSRLSSKFHRTAPALNLHQPRRESSAFVVRWPAPVLLAIAHLPTSPFQFRLPPPIC